MKILYFLAHPNGIGGAAKQMLAHARIMQERGNSVFVVINCNENMDYDKEYDRLCALYGLTSVGGHYPISTCIEEINIMEVLYSLKSLETVVDNYGPDLIHSLQLNIGVEIIARKKGIPHVNTIYQISPGMFNITWMDIFPAYHCSDSLFFCKQWAEGLGIRTECIRVVYRLGKERSYNSVSDGNRIKMISIGSLTQCKRQKVILDFVRICKENNIDVHIDILGYDQGEYGNECKLFVKDNGLENNVTFIGFVSDVEDYLASADLMVHASTVESYPGVIVEAMANRVPVLSTPVAGVPELLIDNENGFVTAGYSSESIYEKFADFLKVMNSGELNEIVERGYQTYLLNHTYEVVGNNLMQYYYSVLESYNLKKEQIVKPLLKKVNNFWLEQGFDSCSKYTADHIWYLIHLKERCSFFSSTLIWGTGEFARIGIEWSRIVGLRIQGFVDSKRQDDYLGYKVYEPLEEILNEAECIIVAVANPDYILEIMCLLEKNGRIRNKNYFLVRNDPSFSTNGLY